MSSILPIAALVWLAVGALAQGGVTTSSLRGIVQDQNGAAVPGAKITAAHEPTGSSYETESLANGKFTIANMRMGGPYTIKISFIGFQESVYQDVYLSLGTAFPLKAVLMETEQSSNEMVIPDHAGVVFSPDRTGAATNIKKETILFLPTLSRSFNDISRLTPQASGRTFLGQDARFNNITIDGSIFSSFGLTDQPGGRTGSTPISLDALEEIQVNVAPFDVRQNGFAGVNVNMVTRSGTNELNGSIFLNTRDQNKVGNKAAGTIVSTDNFNVKQYGLRLGGPIIKNRLFFFISGESEVRSEPATLYTGNSGSETVGGTKTRVLRADLDALTAFLRDTLGYVTGPYEDYNNETRNDKVLIKLDYNASRNHKVSFRYQFLDAKKDILCSNSGALGFGSRNSNINALNYQKSNFIQGEKIESIIGEINSTFGTRLANSFRVGFTNENQDRDSPGQFFPMVEIQQSGSTYITLGYEPFTPFNLLKSKAFQVQENLTFFAGNHILSAGFNFERFSYLNVFFPGSQSVYVYNSLSDFYTDARGYYSDLKDNGIIDRTVSPVTLRRFQLRYVNSSVISESIPEQRIKSRYTGYYIQDEYSPMDGLNISVGLRVDLPSFDNTGYANSTVESQTFVDPEGNPYMINTAKLPDPPPLLSPRLGFSVNLKGKLKTQIRGGTGFFTGRPVLVWISNQIGTNGILTGFDQLNNTTTRPFNPDVDGYVPSVVNIPTPYEIAATDPDYRFPQVWKSTMGLDQELPLGLTGTIDLMISRDIYGTGYFNANLVPTDTVFASGPDQRPRYLPSPAINSNVVNAVILTNSNKGTSTSISVKIEKPFKNGLYALAGYHFGEAKNTIDPSTVAGSSWTSNPIVVDPNNPAVSFSNSDQRHRIISSFTYRKEYAKYFATQVSLFWEARNQGRVSYQYTNDMNGDGAQNDLIYIPRDASEMNFQDYDPDGAGPASMYTAPAQVADWETYIKQDKYLSEHRGEYAVRNGAVLPWVSRADFSIVQEFFISTARGKRNTLQFRADIFNVGNLLTNDWGVGWVANQIRPIRHQGVDVNGRPIHRMNVLSVSPAGQVTYLTESFRKDASINDVWQAQLGIRYIFN